MHIRTHMYTENEISISTILTVYLCFKDRQQLIELVKLGESVVALAPQLVDLVGFVRHRLVGRHHLSQQVVDLRLVAATTSRLLLLLMVTLR